jgi:hypothetical protein
MKTTKVLSALTLVILLAAISMFSIAGNDPGVPKTKIITYTVNITPTPNFPGMSNGFMIAISNGQGRQVVPAQKFHNGVWSYTFTEAGELIKGQRVAVMMQYPAGQSGWYIPTSKLAGYFYGGNTYTFTLTPVSIAPGGKGN